MGRQTFSFGGASLTPESPRPLDDLFGDQIVRINVDPVETTVADGTTRISMGFPVLYVTGWVSEPETFAKRVAEVLTEHFARATQSPATEGGAS